MKFAQSCPTLCNPMDYTVHGILQARILGWSSLSLLQGIFPTQGSNPGLPHCRQILYQMSHKLIDNSPKSIDLQKRIQRERERERSSKKGRRPGVWCRVAGLWAEEVGSYFREDGQGGTLSCNQTHEKHPSRYQVKRSSRRKALCTFKAKKGGYDSTAGNESQGRQGPELKASVDQWERIHLQSRKHGFSPWVRKIPWRRKRLPTPVFLLGKCHGQRSLASYSLWESQKVRHN